MVDLPCVIYIKQKNEVKLFIFIIHISSSVFLIFGSFTIHLSSILSGSESIAGQYAVVASQIFPRRYVASFW